MDVLIILGEFFYHVVFTEVYINIHAVNSMLLF